MSDIVPAWMWRNPEEIIEGLLALSARTGVVRPLLALATAAPRTPPRDRYYTMWRRLHVKQLMRERTMMKDQHAEAERCPDQ